MMTIKRNIWVIAIVILAFILRFNKVTSDPPSLNWDEISIGYNAYSVLKTGRDEWGELMPVHFKSYGEYKLPVQIYASIPAIAIFGLNDFSVRLTPVIYGALTVLFLYFLAKKLLGKEIGLISAFLLAISPWHIQLTRASFESSFSVFWVVLGAMLFIKGFESKKYWIFSVLPFAIAIYTYNAARVFVPVFLLTLFVCYKKEILKNFKTVLFGGTVFLVLLIPLFNFWFNGEATARLKLVSIIDDPGFSLRINEARGNTNLPSPLPRLIHNKVTHFAYVFGKNYLAHFSPDFLFINGAGHKQHHVQGVGELYAFQAPFVLIGLFYLIKRKNRWNGLIFSWLLLAFIPVSITVDSIPHALRTLLAVIPYQIITAYGFLEFYKKINSKNLKKIFLVVISVIVSLGVRNYLINYYSVYPINYSRDWQYGNKQVVDYIRSHYNNYDMIVYTRAYGEPHMFTLFYMNWDPTGFQNDPNLNRFETYDWVRVLNFDKFYFPDLGDKGTQYQDIVNENPGKKILFIGKQGDFPEYVNRIYTVDFLNGDRAFDLVEKI